MKTRLNDPFGRRRCWGGRSGPWPAALSIGVWSPLPGNDRDWPEPSRSRFPPRQGPSAGPKRPPPTVCCCGQPCSAANPAGWPPPLRPLPRPRQTSSIHCGLRDSRHRPGAVRSQRRGALCLSLGPGQGRGQLGVYWNHPVSVFFDRQILSMVCSASDGGNWTGGAKVGGVCYWEQVSSYSYQGEGIWQPICS